MNRTLKAELKKLLKIPYKERTMEQRQRISELMISKICDWIQTQEDSKNAVNPFDPYARF